MRSGTRDKFLGFLLPCRTFGDTERRSGQKGPERYSNATYRVTGHQGEKTVKGEKRKQSLYFPVSMLEEMQNEAHRQERPLSWIMQQAWKLSRMKISSFPGVEDL